ncbi:hypothetical protein ACFFUT_09140 [Pseudohalocynthiibacter aestuariivivens]|uniref:DUF4760 domain-containing protein n=1 Tax=Pseudohalocynthiibacter aestuariivivens TaxID=1591409 RepID=A0ABV5JGW1_9RHOB|nr:hypothetical protein [Pseudohalocynthiibacter aestuariivivens]MBS9718497.1 hypothetical protein [Pseudohalocynthiibacter aestuariivivens]
MIDNFLNQLANLNEFRGFFADLITSFIPVFLGVWLSLRVALKKFVTEKWWERKAQAYESVISALYSSFRYFDEELEANMGGREIGEELKEELDQQYKSGDRDLTQARTIGALHLSKDALSRLQTFSQELKNASETQHFDEYLHDTHSAYTNCTREMIEIAKRDLGIE